MSTHPFSLADLAIMASGKGGGLYRDYDRNRPQHQEHPMGISESEAFAQLAISLIETHGDITCDLAVELMNKDFPDKTPEQIRAALDKLCEADAFASDGENYMVG